MKPRSRSTWIVFAALALTLVFAGLLGVNAVVTGRYHRSVAERVLRDYAAFAADELGNRLVTGFAQRIYPILSSVASESAARPLPGIETVGARADTTTWRIIGSRASVIRVGPGRHLESSGPTLPPNLIHWLTDSLPPRARAHLSSKSYLLVSWIALDGDWAAFVIPSTASTGPRVLAGIVLPLDVAAELSRPTVGRGPLLPSTLTGGAPKERIVAYRVITPDHRVVLEAGDGVESRFAVRRTLDPAWGSLTLDVAVREEAAAGLIVGGLPKSRLPMVLVLFSLTSLLVAIAWIQLQREQTLARQRDDFVASVSHELRTPLAQIRLFAETLQLDRVRSDDERRRSLEIIDQESRRLTNLVENLLTVSRVARGVITITSHPLDLADELRRTVDRFRPIASARGVEIVVAAPDRLPAVADVEAFAQVVNNLLDNAVKFGPASQIVTVTLSAVAGRAHLTVDDQGPGIPVAARERVFERFVRLDREPGAGIAGTGLGLALVRDLVGRHRGTVRVESAPSHNGAPHGTRMVVELPLEGTAS